MQKSGLSLRVAGAALVSLLLVSIAVGSTAPDFSGIWVEAQPESGPPLRLSLTQSDSQLLVRTSYRDSFTGKIEAVATVENGIATWTLPQSCVARFQRPGYNYDNPGVSTFTLSFRNSTDSAQSDPLLVYVHETHWNVPCANNHKIGTERVQKILRRQ